MSSGLLLISVLFSLLALSLGFLLLFDSRPFAAAYKTLPSPLEVQFHET